MGFNMRTTCPDEEKLVDYMEGRLSEKSRSDVEEHLSGCEMCFEGLVITRGLTRDRDRAKLEPVPAKVTEAAVRLVTKRRTLPSGSLIEKLKRSTNNLRAMISDSLQIGPWGRLQPASIRGSKTKASENLVCMAVPFKEIETEIEIEKTGNDMAHIRVKPHEADKHIDNLRVTLKKGEREVASYVMDGPYVLFEDIPFGQYGITLAENGVELGTYVFEVKDTRHGR